MDADAPARFSRSPIWSAHRAYYEQAGPRAWTDDGLPTLVTTSAYMAEAYANMLVDWAEATVHDPDEPVYVVELGAGPGVLGARVAEALFRARLPDTPRLVYVLTDLAEANAQAWADDPLLMGLAEEGVLDFARLDLATPGPLCLRHSGRVLGPGGSPNPVAVIANYLLDCLPCDLFRAEGGALYEVRVAHRWHEGHGAWAFELHPQDAPVAPDYYGDRFLDGLLATYAAELPDAWPLVPVTAIEALRWLMDLGPGGLLLCADKAFRHLEEWAVAGTPHVVTHGRSISVQANTHALTELFRAWGGGAWHGRSAETHLTVSAFMAGPDRAARMRVGRAFDRWLDDPGPVDVFRALGGEDEPLRAQLAALRLAAYDPLVFLRRAEALLSLAPRATPAQRADLARALLEIEARDPKLGGLAHLSFHVGRVSFALGLFAEAAQRFERSLEEADTAPVACYNLHVCARELGHLDQARGWLERALTFDPDFAPAKARLEAWGEPG